MARSGTERIGQNNDPTSTATQRRRGGSDLNPYYQDEAVTIYHGDCREILPDLPKVDLVLTDPPYGVNGQYAESYIDDADSYWGWFLPIIKTLRSAALRLVFTHRVAALRVITDADWIGCWCKPNASSGRLGNSHLFPSWEPVFLYGIHKSAGLVYGKDVWVCDAVKVSAEGMSHGRERFARGTDSPHPFPKPLLLYSEFARQFSAVDETILDPFLGSGTTAVAAKKLNRKCIGIEIEERYCEIAANRCRQMVMDLSQ